MESCEISVEETLGLGGRGRWFPDELVMRSKDDTNGKQTELPERASSC